MNSSIMHYFFAASPIVKVVMLILLGLSILSWMIIFQRGYFLHRARQACADFEQTFWSTEKLQALYDSLKHANYPGYTVNVLAAVFQAGYQSLSRLSHMRQSDPGHVLEAVYRAMRVACAKESDRLSQHLSLLATIGSTTPYIGLFGTVWGIMSSFQALGGAQQVTLAMVAPGIAEALVATAMGLFAAIPAVIAYNRYSNGVELLVNQMEIFQDEFSSLLIYQQHRAIS